MLRHSIVFVVKVSAFFLQSNIYFPLLFQFSISHVFFPVSLFSFFFISFTLFGDDNYPEEWLSRNNDSLVNGAV